jgi:hypothetical protein
MATTTRKQNPLRKKKAVLFRQKEPKDFYVCACCTIPAIASQWEAAEI